MSTVWKREGKKGKSNFSVEKRHKHYYKQMIKVSINLVSHIHKGHSHVPLIGCDDKVIYPCDPPPPSS